MPPVLRRRHGSGLRGRPTVNVNQNEIRRILIIKLRALGDVLLSTIVTKNLRLAFPNASIEYLVETPSVDIVRPNPYIDGVLEFNPRTMSGLELIRRVRRERYDMVIDLFGNPRTALLTRLSGARHRVGYRFRGRTYAYTIVAEPRGGEVHNTEFNLDALRAIGVAIQDRTVYFQFRREDAVFVDDFLRGANPEGKRLIGIGTGGGWYTKRWGLERFGAVADLVVEKYGALVVLLWGPGQLPDVRTVKSAMKHVPFIPPETTLLQLGALIHRCSAVVTNDSGPMHIAAALGTPVLGIYGPTNPTLQGPYGDKHCVVRNESVNCLGCNLTKCPIGHPCMLELSVETVSDAFDQLLRKNRLTE